MANIPVHPAGTVLMVRPALFGFNPETAGSNAFQKADPGSVHEPALAEFDALVELLESAGVNVIVYQSPDIEAPDCCFPNNWFASLPGGELVLFPMAASNRKRECNTHSVSFLKQQWPHFTQTIDLRTPENVNAALEGTGSIVYDHTHKLAYASRSSRTDEYLFLKSCDLLGYTPVVFDALDRNGGRVYHTNVVLHIGDKYALVCTESIPDGRERECVLERLGETGHELVEVNFDQMDRFACNAIQLMTSNGRPAILISASAYKSFDEIQINKLQKHGDLLIGTIPTIERVGGGSVRCMVAELYLPADGSKRN